MGSHFGTARQALAAIGYALDVNPSDLIAADDIDRLVRFAFAYDRERYCGEELAAIALLRDGRYAALEGGCDYTGWDGQSSLDVSVHDTAEDAWLNGITRDGRAHIERAEAAPARA